MNFIIVTGGVLSSLGKGITCGSLATILESHGLKVALMKLDPYLNIDPGTMNPFQHGEVYVTDDGAETDLDLGHYHRFSNSTLSRSSSASAGQIYETVLRNERSGEYLGSTVQVVPHITDEIQRRILSLSKDADIGIIEIGGTVGDIESQPFLEAIRQLKFRYPEKVFTVHVTYVPYIKAAKELKTKPTQHSVQILRSIGIVPNALVCRAEEPISEELTQKISLFCSVPASFVWQLPDVKTTIYEVPLILHQQMIDRAIMNFFGYPYSAKTLAQWEELLHRASHIRHKVKIGLVGKYVEHRDADKSVREALAHAGFSQYADVEIIPIRADLLDDQVNLNDIFNGIDGIVVPGGFGERGWSGKIKACQYAREHKIPYFGICLGMQVMCVEFARNVLHLDANSTEMEPSTPHPIICLLSEQKEIKFLGGTMRLGAYGCKLLIKSKAQKIYGKERISERHRHRYELNPSMIPALEKGGLIVSGQSEREGLCEIVELNDHPWMIGVQFHPEFLSKPTNPHPLFISFITQAIANGKNHRN